MLSEPGIETRVPQPYAARSIEVRQDEIVGKAPPLITQVMDWVKANGGKVTGPPFFNYFEFLPGSRMKMEVGVPTQGVMAADGGFVSGELPGGRYASITCTGPYPELYEANMALGNWVKREGLALAEERRGEVLSGATRLEIYRDPGTSSAPPVTDVAFRLQD